ncbi:restriction endonuclease [Candidatus Woesearchaeota archaeon]|nr:restriction endonuclease [Candidatus Woesearchaeota archaeon]
MINLSIYDKTVLETYKSNSQRARVLTEKWFNSNMYCPSCLNNNVTSYPNNKKVYDFLCEKCSANYQLKASNKKFTTKILDGEFKTMITFVTQNIAPSFFLLHYNNDEWYVKDLSVIPKFFITSSIIEKRKALSINARRAGWTGCNILLNRIPDEGNIFVVRNKKVIEKEIVFETWRKMSFLNLKRPNARGWTADVLRCVEDLEKEEFTLQDIYKNKDYLNELYPNNKHVTDKIRQQLQILRNNHILQFTSRGNYKIIK